MVGGCVLASRWWVVEVVRVGLVGSELGGEWRCVRLVLLWCGLVLEAAYDVLCVGRLLLLLLLLVVLGWLWPLLLLLLLLLLHGGYGGHLVLQQVQHIVATVALCSGLLLVLLLHLLMNLHRHGRLLLVWAMIVWRRTITRHRTSRRRRRIQR